MPLQLPTHPELAQGVDVLGFEQRIIVAVHQALAMHHGCIVHQDGDVSHLWHKGCEGYSGLVGVEGLGSLEAPISLSWETLGGGCCLGGHWVSVHTETSVRRKGSGSLTATSPV